MFKGTGNIFPAEVVNCVTHCESETEAMFCTKVNDDRISIPCCRVVIAGGELSSVRSTPEPPTRGMNDQKSGLIRKIMSM